MYIKSVLQHFDCWKKLQNNYHDDYLELLSIIQRMSIENIISTQEGNDIQTNTSTRKNYSLEIHREFEKQFSENNWITNIVNRRIIFGSRNNNRYTQLDGIKNNIGIEISFGKYAFTESIIFVKFPIFYQAGLINFGIIILPSKELINEYCWGVSSFEMISDRLEALILMPIRYPLAILEITHNPIENTIVESLTSELDNFLLSKIGATLGELQLQAERTNYDFKSELSPQPERIAKEICAFANQKGGGFLLIGFENNGNAIGIDRNRLDDIELRISHIAHNNVIPNPEISFDVFDLAGDLSKCLLLVSIFEIEHKPCIANERVYIRTGNEAVSARSEQIRKIVFESGE